MANQITPNPSVPSQVVAEVKFPKFINNLGIIPTSYKDSMSYYECLAWLCKYLEETVIPTVNENGEAVEELQNLYVELNSYVTHYFDTLNVQEEINNKLDSMVQSGELQVLLTEQYDALRSEVNNSIEQFEDYTNNVINNNNQVLNNKIDAVTSGSPAGVYATVSALQSADPDHSKIYVVSYDGKWYYYDSTLSSWVAGGTYQASVDTDTTNTLVKNFNKITDSGTIRNSMTINKAISGTTFLLVDVSGNSTITTTDVFEAKEDILIELPDNSGYKYLIAFYSSDEFSTDGHISNTTWQTGNYLIEKGKFFAIQFRKEDNSAFLSEDEKYNLGIRDLASYEEFNQLYTPTTNLINNFEKITESGNIRNTMTINKGINGVTFLLQDVLGNTTITTTEVFEAKEDILIELPDNSGYKYLIAFYSSDEFSTDGHISNTTWQTGNYLIEKGKFFAIQFRKEDNSAFSSQDEKYNLGIKDLASYQDVKELQDIILNKPTLYHIIGTGQSLAVRS